jgi:hypothetical protein
LFLLGQLKKLGRLAETIGVGWSFVDGDWSMLVVWGMMGCGLSLGGATSEEVDQQLKDGKVGRWWGVIGYKFVAVRGYSRW